ncbi:hypothetical protein H8B15_12915 [Hymenobacter sp. BT507]|uniref:Uncharacterized protein n=1 Tax=Hymenobacter citatus TaxID=2763506 RepID=A0ABR7ML66_9BACT|nr:hypothetical protein [Hymenobacter citatus]MBC6611829.1 hypothetical protein [Hymenobacter citatus]
MYFPRRYRRKLFFPPGLLALAFLLLMGCMWVSRDVRLKPKYVIELNMPPPYPTNDPGINPPPYSLSKDKLERFRKWDNFIVTGNKLQDSISLSFASKIALQYQIDTLQEKGMRIILQPKSKYVSMITILDIMKKSNIKKYWFDIFHSPTTFYAITEKYVPTSITEKSYMFICGTSDHIEIINYSEEAKESFLSRLKQFILPFFISPWRNSLFLLFLIGIVSMWKTMQFRWQP